MECVCFSFDVGLLFYQLFVFQTGHSDFDAISLLIKHANINMLIIFGTHNLQTFKHNTLINKLLLMQFYLIAS